jgi:hypothetical protein
MGKKFNLEHPMDRLKRLCNFVKFRENVRGCERWPLSAPIKLVDGFEYSTFKNGRFTFMANPLTSLKECVICKTVASPKKFTHLYGDYRIKNFEELGISTGICCWSCRNKVQPIINRLVETELLLTQIRIAKRKINESTKNNAPAA